MGNRTAKFMSALIGSIIAGAPLAAVSQNAPVAPSTANAAADCLGAPKGTAPQGQHWFYRLDRGTKRQCWYLRAGGSKASQTAQAATDTPAEQAAPSQPHSVQDARAEYVGPRSAVAPNAAAQASTVAPAPLQQAAPADASAQQPPAAPRPDAAPPAVAEPAPQSPPAAVVTAPAQPAAKPTKAPAPVALATADSTADKPTGSLQMLLLVIGGALALAGLLASLIYRFAGGRVRVQQASDHRRVNWDNFEPHDRDDSRAPWRDATPADAPQRRPVDFDAERPQAVHPQATQPKTTRPQAPRPQASQIAAFTSEIGRIAAQSRSTSGEVVDLDESDIFNGEFEIVTAAPQLAVTEADNDRADEAEEPVARDEDGVDIDVITAMLERLANEGPRLMVQPSPEAELAALAQSRRGPSAARA